jgi:hypothetical protein
MAFPRIPYLRDAWRRDPSPGSLLVAEESFDPFPIHDEKMHHKPSHRAARGKCQPSPSIILALHVFCAYGIGDAVGFGFN